MFIINVFIVRATIIIIILKDRCPWPVHNMMVGRVEEVGIDVGERGNQ